MGNEVAGGVHDLYGGFAVFDADVDVEAEDQIAAGNGLHVFDDGGVTLVGINFLFAPVGEGVGGRGGDAEAILFCEADEAGAQFVEVCPGLLNVVADAGADFDNALVHFGLDAFGEEALTLADDFGADVRTKVPCFGVDGLVFLFDPDRKRGLAHSTDYLTEEVGICLIKRSM